MVPSLPQKGRNSVSAQKLPIPPEAKLWNDYPKFAMKIRMLLQKRYRTYVITTVDSAKGLTNGASFTLRPIL